MIQLSTFMWGMVVLFALIGFVRGSTKEMIALAGIVLAIFVLEQFRDMLLSPLVAGASLDQQFYLYAGILIVIVVFAYETPERFQNVQRSRAFVRAFRKGCWGRQSVASMPTCCLARCGSIWTIWAIRSARM